jgi:hypothetical protein
MSSSPMPLRPTQVHDLLRRARTLALPTLVEATPSGEPSALPPAQPPAGGALLLAAATA